MDFTLDEGAEAARQLVSEVLASEIGTSSAVPSAEAEKRASAALIDTGILAAFTPLAAGDDALDATAAAAIVHEIAMCGAGLPLAFALPGAVLPLARFAGPVQHDLLEKISAGSALVVGARREPGRTTASDVRTRAAASAVGYLLSGVKTLVPYGGEADHVLVPAQVEGAGVGVFVVPTAADGVTVIRQESSSYVPAAAVRLDSVTVGADALLGPADGTVARYLDLSSSVGNAAFASGLASGALRVTKEHVSIREQFGRPLAQFQAVSLQVADAFIAETLMSTLALAASYELAKEYLEAATETLVAADLALVDHVVPAMFACMHVHGGLGLDTTHLIYRFLSANLFLAQSVGGREGALDRATGALTMVGAF